MSFSRWGVAGQCTAGHGMAGLGKARQGTLVDEMDGMDGSGI
jgi:hypothetical protein